MNSQIMVNNASNSEGNMIFTQCNGFTGDVVMPNSTNSRVCGYESRNLSTLSACCNGAELQQYQCWTYCRYTDTLTNFHNCINRTTSGNYTLENVFCQSGLQPNVTESLKTSFGFKTYSAPRISWLVLAFIFAILFIDPTCATIIPSLDNSGVLRRQSTGCTFTLDHQFARNGRQRAVASGIACPGEVEFCPESTSINTGISENNRTINGTSAADSRYDQIFEIVGNATHRTFPAQSSLQTVREYFIRAGQTGYLTWAPLHLCFNGTLRGCKGILGDSNDATNQEFCGPAFTSVDAGNSSQNVIQGSFIVVQEQ